VGVATPEEVRGTLRWAPDLLTSTGVLHGGALMALGDALGGICALLNVPEGATTATVESHTNFLHAISSGEVNAVSQPIHVGRSFVVIQTDLVDTDGRLAARVTQTQAVLDPLERPSINDPMSTR
jgi:uncharacterized protein (TIGR00369 family)